LQSRDAGCHHQAFSVCAKKQKDGRFKEIRNAKVFRDYFVEDKLETGIVLTGTEMKSIRSGRAQITDAFAKIEKGEVILRNMHIDEYAFGNIHNHQPKRPRKLLLHRKEIDRLNADVSQGGKALVPVRMYFKQGLVKVELAVCTGKKLYDKRETLKKKTQMQEIEREMRRRR